MKLVVTSAFGKYQPGDEITDSEEIEAVLETHAASVVQVDNAATSSR